MDELYINIGTENSCLFVKMSIYLIDKLEQHPLLYYAVEESLKCAKEGYYGIGIIYFSQLLNLFSTKTPESRHLVAHEGLQTRPTKVMLDEAIEFFKEAASKQSDHECKRHSSEAAYVQCVHLKWDKFIKRLHGI